MGLEALVPADEGWRLDRERPTPVLMPEQLAALARIGQELTSGPTLGEGFRRAMRLLDERLGATHSALFTTNAGQRSLNIEVLYGAAPDDFRVRLGLGVAGRVAETGRPIVVPAVRQEPMALSELTAADAWHGEHLSLVAVPILSRGSCVGALSVYFTTDPAIGFAARLNLVQVVAAVIAQGLPPPAGASGQEPAAEPSERAAFEYANMIGSSPGMRQVYEEIGQVASTKATALILGESGTGKELVAQAIHANSERARRPFIKISAAAFPETLFESELFGYERGAFTGAVGRKKGRLDWAEGGTLFLDEIGDLSLQAQVKLLRVLQFREFERLGGTETLKADVRLIAATNKSMEQATLSGTFREDLYYRLNVFTITVPPLRERRTDVPTLVEYFLEKYSNEHRRKAKRIASSALDVLCQYGWPGNVRELENAIERAVVSCDGSVLEERHLPKTLRLSSHVAVERKLSLAQAVEELERRMIEDALAASKGNLARASRTLGTTERILRYKVSKYKLEPIRARSAP
jgi:Nif-specific regulatory protein